MPSYQEALKLAVDKEYKQSVEKLHQTVKEVETQVGPSSNFHLFLFQRIASVHLMLGEIEKVEETFQKCVTVAENVKMPLSNSQSQTTSTFMWQNNLLKFYLQHDIQKATQYA